MTISTTVRKAGPYTGNAVTTSFAFAFKVFDETDVVVTQTEGGVETVKTLTTHYTVSLNADQNANPGGSVVMLSAPTALQTITLTSDVPLTQGIELTDLGAFYPSILNDGFDRATIQIQQLGEIIGRALTLPTTASGVDTQLPLPEAGYLIGWDGAGTGLQNYANTVSAATVTSTGSTTARTLADRFAECTNVKDHGATGDGTTDDTTAIQAAITAANATTHKRLYFPAGTYKLTAQLLIHSGATWFGDGANKSILAVHSSAGNIIPFRTNTTSGTKNVFDQTDVALYDMHFKGFDAVLTVTASDTHAPLMRLWKIDGLTIERCKFSAHRYIMLSLGGVKNFSITNSEFEDWGRTDDLASSGTLPANEGGAAIWCAANPTDDTPSTLGTMRGNYFHDAEWSCVYLLGQYLDFSLNRMENTKEGNYARCTDVGADSESRNITYIGNTHKGVTKRLIAATGFECGAKGVVISGNVFEDCVASAIDLSDTCEAAIITDNYCLDCATSGDFLEYASITIRVTSVTADALDGVTVANNNIRSSAGNYGIRLYRVSGSDTFNNIRIVDNDLVGAAADSADYLVYTAGQFGSDVVLKDNNGADDYAVSATWSPTITASAGTLTTTSTPTARYWKDGPTVHFTIAITLTDIGTGSGNLRFTLPSTPAYAGACVGTNAANGKGIHGNWATTTTVNCTYYDATFPAISGHTVRISGVYMEA